MKLKTIVMCVLAFGLVFSIFGAMMNDMGQQYQDVNINDSGWSKYADGGSLNPTQSIAGNGTILKGLLENLVNQDSSWFSKIASGIVAIPVAILQAIVFVFQSMAFANNILVDILANTLAIPQGVIYALETILLIAIIFAIVSFFQRHPA